MPDFKENSSQVDNKEFHKPRSIGYAHYDYYEDDILLYCEDDDIASEEADEDEKVSTNKFHSSRPCQVKKKNTHCFVTFRMSGLLRFLYSMEWCSEPTP